MVEKQHKPQVLLALLLKAILSLLLFIRARHGRKELSRQSRAP